MPKYNKFLLGTDGAWFALLLVSGFAIYNMFTGAPEMVHLMTLIAVLMVGFYYSCAKTLEACMVASGIERAKRIRAEGEASERINSLRRENDELRAAKRQLVKELEEQKREVMRLHRFMRSPVGEDNPNTPI